MKHKGVLIAVVVLLSAMAVGVALLFANGVFAPNTETGVSTTSPELNVPEPTPTPTPTQVVELQKPEEVAKEETVVEGYVDFVYDVNESADEYLKSKVSIQGSGTVVEMENRDDVIVDSNGNVIYSGGDFTQEFWTKESQNKDTYLYVVDSFDYSKGFGALVSVKYDINIDAIIGNTAVMSAPNNTKVKICELDMRKGNASYWRNATLDNICFGYYSMIVDEPIIEYETPYILGTGLKEWTYKEFYDKDLTVNSSANQLLCDTMVNINFGESYYIEYYNSDYCMYHGYLITQHGDRVYQCHAESEYRDSLRDICMACMDRCIQVY